jgi:hypothetical protein
MPLTVGKIGDLPRHFRGEVYSLAEKPPSQKSDRISMRALHYLHHRGNEPVNVRCVTLQRIAECPPTPEVHSVARPAFGARQIDHGSRSKDGAAGRRLKNNPPLRSG